MEETRIAQFLKIFLVLITFCLSLNPLLSMEDDLDTNQPLLQHTEQIIDIPGERESQSKENLLKMDRGTVIGESITRKAKRILEKNPSLKKAGDPRYKAAVISYQPPQEYNIIPVYKFDEVSSNNTKGSESLFLIKEENIKGPELFVFRKEEGQLYIKLRDQRELEVSDLSEKNSIILSLKEGKNIKEEDRTALLKYREESGYGEHWDDTYTFLYALDEDLFVKGRSKKTIALQIFFALVGGAASIGTGPLTVVLGQKYLTFIPEGSLAFFITTSSVIAPTYMRLTYEVSGNAGNALFDKRGLTPSKNDKKPHRIKLVHEANPKCGKRQCICRLPVWPVEIIGSTIKAIPVPLSLAMLMLKLYKDFPTPSRLMATGLFIVNFIKEWRESHNLCRSLANKAWTESIHMMAEKKRILKERLMEMKRRVNAPSSELLVAQLYTEAQKQIKRLQNKTKIEKESKGGGKLSTKQNESFIIEEVKNTEEKEFSSDISIFSLFFFKRDSLEVFKEAELSLKEKIKKVEPTLQKKGEHSSVNASLEEMKDLTEFVQNTKTLVSSKPQEMTNLITDIDFLPKKTNARTFLENLAVYLQGFGGTAIYGITQWAVEQILGYFGVDPHTAYVVATSSAGVTLVLKSLIEWKNQEETLLSTRNFGSTATDFWPLRWIGKVVSGAASLFCTLTSIDIISEVLGNTIPKDIKFLITAAMFPSQFSGYFNFFDKMYGKILTGMVTLSIPENVKKDRKIRKWFLTKQQRAWLNEQFEKIDGTIDEFDQESTEKTYNLLQGGV